MKKVYLLFFVSFCFSITLFAQNNKIETERIAIFCKVWGFLKYYHPAVTSGKLDWDKEFIIRIDSLDQFNSKLELSNFFVGWINTLGKVDPCRKCTDTAPDSLTFNLNNNWTEDTSLFTRNLINLFKNIINNRNTGDNYYVSSQKNVGNTVYDNEKQYKDSVFPSSQLRLLGLSRYWNIINYFYPYKYVIGEDWDNILEEMIPKFKYSQNVTGYHLAMLELITKINDSHAGFFTPYINEYFGFKAAPFYCKIIEDKAIVLSCYNDSFCKANDIRRGDVFLSVKGISIKTLLNQQSKYINASNESVKRRNAAWTIFSGQADSVNIQFERDGVVASKVIRRYLHAELNFSWNERADTTKMLDGNIGYVNMGLLEQSQVDSIMNKFKNTKAIIFDVRNYPKGTMYYIAAFLNNDRKPFAKFTIPDISYPGVFKYTKPAECGIKKNKNYYKGKVVLLFNELTQSHAEFTLMALQTAPDVISIGSQTAGADGNVSLITLPGDYETYMTGIGVYYPDGRPTQRIGIVPDIIVTPTIKGIRQGKDEVLDKAQEVLRSK